MTHNKWKGKKKPSIDSLLTIAHDNQQLSDFLVGHLLIESLIVQLIDTKLSAPEKFNTFRLIFPQKIGLGLSMNLMPKELGQFLIKVNGIRNKYAHNFGFSLTFEEIFLLINEGGKVGVDFNDGIDTDKKFAKQMYKESILIKLLFDTLAKDIAFLIDENGGEYPFD